MLGPGSLLTPTIRLVRPLQQGGMGSVWIAYHLTLATQVVVKFMSDALVTTEVAAARFSREAAAAAQVKSPHVVQMLDFGVNQDKVPYIVMELLEGEDLGSVLKRGPLEPRPLAMVVDQVARALDRAHERGIVHRDVKPSNIFLCHTGGPDIFAKLLDFGIAKQLDDLAAVTKTGEVIGTPAYMSPEQLTGAKDLDARADLWSLGVVAYRALVGAAPFQGDSIPAIALAIVSGVLPRPSQQNPTLPASFDAWFARACAREKEARFGGARELASALWISLGLLEASSMPSIPLLQAPAAPGQQPEATLTATANLTGSQARAPQRRGTLFGAAVGALVTASLAAAGIAAFSYGRAPTSERAQPVELTHSLEEGSSPASTHVSAATTVPTHGVGVPSPSSSGLPPPTVTPSPSADVSAALPPRPRQPPVRTSPKPLPTTPPLTTGPEF